MTLRAVAFRSVHVQGNNIEYDIDVFYNALTAEGVNCRISRGSLTLANMAEKLLDFSQPFDVPILDATIQAFYGTGAKEEVRLHANCLYSC